MARFKITDNQTGKSVVVSGDSAPSEQEAEQIFSDAGFRQAPAAAIKPPAQPAINPVVDAVHALPGGAAKGAAGIAGLPGDAIDLTQSVADWVSNKLSLGKAGDIRTSMGAPSPLNPIATMLALPTSGQVNTEVSKPFGGYYKPQTDFGKYAETVASFAPNAVAPGSLAARAARVVVPGVASEAAGQATKGSKFEPLARAGGALAGGLLVGGAEGAIAAAKNPTPTLDELGAAKNAAYKAADDAGVVIAPPSFSKFATDLGSDITKNNVVQADLHKNALAALNIIQDEAASGAPISLARADAIRQAVNGSIEAAAKNNNSDLRLAQKVKAGFDSYLDSLTPQDVVSGDAEAAVPILREARGLAQREYKAKEIQKLIDLAENQASSNYSASGVEQALRVQFKNLNAKLIKEPALAKTFSDTEREAIQRVAKGGPVGNALRLVGKLAPTNVISGGAGVGLGAYGGGLVGGPVGAAIGSATVPAIGAAARSGATAMTRRNANLAAEIMRRGTPLAGGPKADLLLLDTLLSQQAAH